MDCGKPAYGWPGNVVGSSFNRRSVVIPCRRDGYTRVNDVPKVVKGVDITPVVNYNPLDDLRKDVCCSNTSYGNNWMYCSNSADKALGTVKTCDTCMAYQCLDWTVLSKGMQERQDSYEKSTNDKVYFGVGAFGNNPKKGNYYAYYKYNFLFF